MPKARAKKSHGKKTPKSYTTEDWKKIYRKSKRHVPASMRGGSGGGGGSRQPWWMPLAHTGETYAVAGGIGYLWSMKGPDYRPVANIPVELTAAMGLHGLAFAASTMGWGKALAPHLHALGDGAIAADAVKRGMLLGMSKENKAAAKLQKDPRLVMDAAAGTVTTAPKAPVPSAQAPAGKTGGDEYGEDQYGYDYGAESIAADNEG